MMLTRKRIERLMDIWAYIPYVKKFGVVMILLAFALFDNPNAGVSNFLYEHFIIRIEPGVTAALMGVGGIGILLSPNTLPGMIMQRRFSLLFLAYVSATVAGALTQHIPTAPAILYATLLDFIVSSARRREDVTGKRFGQ